jgi:hypothetical protein
MQRGPPDSPYAGGEYHGLIMFPNDYREYFGKCSHFTDITSIQAA